MTKFASSARPNVSSPIGTTDTLVTNHNGSAAWEFNTKTELFILALTNMVGEDTFYESATTRDTRFRKLIHTITKDDPEWMQKFIPWLRTEANMRSASLVAIAEYIKAKGPKGRELVKNTLTRADEPAELLAYWMSNYGKNVPQALRKGISDAVTVLYTETSMMKYNSSRHDVRPADVLEICHPSPKSPYQSDLFKWIIDDRHNRDWEIPKSLIKVRSMKELTKSVSSGAKKASEITSAEIKAAGITHQRLSGMTKMDGDDWSKQIPTMGLMAILKNLRNFDDKGITKEAQDIVWRKLMSPEDIKGSRVFPYRFLSAWKATNSLNWATALEVGLNLSCQNIPELPGKTLVLIDRSGSMTDLVTRKTENNKNNNEPPMRRYEVAALFAAALAKRCENVDIAVFATRNMAVPIAKNDSVLRYIDKIGAINKDNSLDHGTFGYTALKDNYKNHDRVVFFTDEQMSDSQNRASSAFSQAVGIDSSYGISQKVKSIWSFNLGGYDGSMMESGQKGRYTLGGLNDATFKLMPLIEAGSGNKWPWDIQD